MCGIFGIYVDASKDTDIAAKLTYLALMALQHRGQESAGIVTSNKSTAGFPLSHKGMGLVSTVFDPTILSRLKGQYAVGHVRYATSGASSLQNCQPFTVDTALGPLTLAHNGQLTNAGALRERLLRRVGLSSGSDSELILQLLTAPLRRPDSGAAAAAAAAQGQGEAEEAGMWPERIAAFMKVSGNAYSLVLLTGDAMFAVRDPYGIRPLCIGRLHALTDDSSLRSSGTIKTDYAGGYVVASESCAFTSIGAELVREVLPGEVIRIDRTGFTTVYQAPKETPCHCIFEHIYFARDDSVLEGQYVHEVRERIGAQLALESLVEIDYATTVPSAATPSAMGFAQQAGVPYRETLHKNRFTGRSFIAPDNSLRKQIILTKFAPLRGNVAGKRLAAVDDSIVRGNTMPHIINLMRDAGAREVHVRLSSPPIKHPCNMGVDVPTYEELIAHNHSIEEIRKLMGADTLQYVSLGGLLSAVGERRVTQDKQHVADLEELAAEGRSGFCTACLNGVYPPNATAFQPSFSPPARSPLLP
eukprot:m51a1_g1046 amidophosphoribosyltransferase, putative (530) ;mRNA; r:745172-747540